MYLHDFCISEVSERKNQKKKNKNVSEEKWRERGDPAKPALNLLSSQNFFFTILTKVASILRSITSKFLALIKVTLAVVKHQSNLGKTTFIPLFIVWYNSESRNSHKAGRNVETGAAADATEECCLLTCSSWLPQPAFLQNTEPETQGWHHPQRAGPSHINH